MLGMRFFGAIVLCTRQQGAAGCHFSGLKPTPLPLNLCVTCPRGASFLHNIVPEGGMRARLGRAGDEFR